MTESVATPLAPQDGSVPLSELALRYALNSVEYCHAFFPKTFRQQSAPFHPELFKTLDDPRNRNVGIEVFRGGAKTTILRVFTSKRIAYGTSRTVMYNSESSGHSIKSVRWLRRQVEFNKKWTNFYRLEKGKKWTDDWLEIYNAILDITVSVVAVGITGQVRGLNIDDYRPDLIINDDVDNEETTGTPEQRLKTENLFFGAIANSLTPSSENPEAKNVLLATSLHKDDTINKCHADPTWATHKFPIFNSEERSAWPARWTTEQLLEEKQAFVNRGQILLWLREMECTIGDEETASFRKDWLKFWDVTPERMLVILTCDPAPPPSEAQLKKGLASKDEEVWSVQGLSGGKRFLLEQVASKDHDPEWSANVFFSLVAKWRPLKTIIETIAYQRTLKSFLEMKMREKKTYHLIEGYPPPGMERDRRKKRHRILQAFSGIGSQGQLFVHPTMLTFISQFSSYPNCDHDDRLDAAAIGFEALENLSDLDENEMYFLEEGEPSTMEQPRWAP